jgi:DNA topoisomerase-1
MAVPPRLTSVSRPARSDATAVGLRYVSPDSPGIARRRAGRGFRYLAPTGKPISDAATLARIRQIVIPPAWTEVWISPDPTGHIQATGRDARGRRQYRYHPHFRARRDRDKFSRLVRFGKALPRIRRAVRHDLARRGLPREKVLAAVVRLLETTSFRVGNAEYARLNRSFGLSTLRSRHARVSGGSVRFRFRGKGGRLEERTLVDRGLAAVVRRCQDLPGQALFQYLDDDEERAVTSEDVNDYIREAAGTDEFTAKDFRTWVATVLAHRALHEAGLTPNAPRADRIRDAIRQTAVQLNDTVAITRSSYVHPAVLAAFQAEDSSIVRRATRAPDADRPIKRRDELALLATLRHRPAPESPARAANASGRPKTARRSQVARAGVAARRGRPRA